MNSLRIAHVTATFPPYEGGAGNACFYMAREQARRGHAVTIFTAKTGGNYEYPKEMNVRRLPPLFCIGNAPFLPGLFGIKGFEVIHLQHPFIFGAEIVWAISKLRGIPYLISHQNDLIGFGLRKYIFNIYSAISTRIVLKEANKFAVLSLDHARYCRLSVLFKSRWEDVVEVPNGVDIELFRNNLDGRIVRDKYGIPQNANMMLFVGALDRAHHFKGVDYLLRGFSLIKDPNTFLVIVGDGDLKKRFIDLSIRLNVYHQTRFVGSIANQSLPLYYAAANLLVLPSFPPESFGIVLIEAMACGRPVIAHNIPGVRSVVDEGENGLLAEPGNVEDLAKKIEVLLNDPVRSIEMGECGRAKVEEKYTWPKIVEYLDNIYIEIIDGR